MPDAIEAQPKAVEQPKIDPQPAPKKRRRLLLVIGVILLGILILLAAAKIFPKLTCTPRGGKMVIAGCGFAGCEEKCQLPGQNVTCKGLGCPIETKYLPRP